jgi:CDP-diacylglycerol--glycerol-3-phosphate 3-phosphatidyltransferase
MPFNIPILLTWLRIAAIPLFIVVLYFPEEWLATRHANVISMAIFVAAAVTDWLDGYLARKWGQTSSFGAFLDPVADKLMVAAALIVLVELGRTDAIVALIIIGREITISALREWMAEIGKGKKVAVALIGKAKTVVQLVAIPFLLFDGLLFSLLDTRQTGRGLVWVAAVLTLISMFYYFFAAFAEFRESGSSESNDLAAPTPEPKRPVS